MARQKRMNFMGYCYLTSRGSGGRVIFKEREDYLFFERLLVDYSQKYHFILHNYALIGVEYFLLLETTEANLSKIMGQLNGVYSRYFNKKYNYSGHLWHDRYRCWYITNNHYIPSIIRYIEQKPFKLTQLVSMGNYPYSTARYFLDTPIKEDWLSKSWMATHYTQDGDFIKMFLNMSVDNSILRLLKKESRDLEEKVMDKKITTMQLDRFFSIDMSKKSRNIKIVEASQKGFSQYQIAECLGISQPAVHIIIKRLQATELF